MKKWFKFFCLSFFSNKISKEAEKRSYTSFFIGLILALVFLWLGFAGGDMLPFNAHYNRSPSFQATAHALLANVSAEKRITVEIQNNRLNAKKQGGEYGKELLVNTLENADDKQSYSVNGCEAVIDLRPADTLAEVEAYCVSNNGANLEITYQEYLALNEANKLNFDFKLKYTGKALELNGELVEGYKAYVEGLSEENKQATEKLASDFAESKITQAEYYRAIYELYFTNYYPSIKEYESSSKVPLLRNYYYHQYINKGISDYLFIFDDYLAGSFTTQKGIILSFYGFYSNVDNGILIAEGVEQAKANELVDKFIKSAYGSITSLSLYAHAMNTLSLAPFIALMPMVVTLLAYSLLKLRGVESINTLGSAFKIIGSYVWFSALISTVLTVIIAFFVQRSMINALPLVFFFITLAVRAIIFAVKESQAYIKRLEQQEERVGTEV